MKVLLADDEYLIRNGLRNSVHWEKHDMEVVGTAADGEQALALAREHKPDLVITDICMPFMDGLELSEAVLREQPETSVILLTGYDEFDYAKRAIKLGIVDYVLKPIDLEYIENLLDEVAYKRGKRHAQLRNGKRAQLMNAVLRRGNGQKPSDEELEWADISPTDCYACIMVGILGYRFAEDMFEKRELQDYFNQFAGRIDACAGEMAVFQERSVTEGRILLIISGKDAQQAADRMQSVLRALKQDEVLSNESPFLCATDGISEDIWALQEAYYHCQTVMQYDFLNDETTFLDYAELKRIKNDDGMQLSKDIASFVNCIRMFDKRLIERNVEDITGHIRDSGRYSGMYGQMFIASAYSQMLNTLQEFEIDLDDVFENPIEVYRHIVAGGSLQQQMRELANMLSVVCDYVHSKSSSAHRILVEKARQYINTHFMEYDISLQRVAEAVHISPCYFSILFKQESGQSFVSYLTELRMEKAKQMLQYTDQKAYEIAMAIGYDNPTYFSTLFKKHTKLSPKEFRQQYSKRAKK